MHELRKDYLLDDWVIIASGREKRPQHLEIEQRISPKAKCPFCPGHEGLTPPEITRVPIQSQNWRIRVVPNKFSAVQETGIIESLKLPFRSLKTAFGRHEVIIETPLHNLQMADFSLKQIMEILNVFIERVNALEALKEVKEVSLFKNQGVKAGASLSHAHSQIIALNKLSEKTKRELKAFEESFEKNQKCPYCEIIGIEMNSQRRVFENDSFACFTPFASRAAYQLLIFPKRHSRHFNEMGEKEKRDFSEILKKALLAVKELGADFNLYFKNAPPSVRDFHWYANIMPCLITRAGFEESTECIINIYSPEECASFYRKEFAGLSIE